MGEYLVLARKYRSRTFGEVVGQEPIARTLRNAIATGRVAHAYLFNGTRGVGKTTMARILAKALNCLSVEEPTETPCNECDACEAIARGDDIDVIEIDGASNRGIEEIRELRANAIFRPARSRYKIYYIDEVHMLTREAFNSLLKTLEEPPGHVKFIFATTEAEKVPATILSRCQRYDFRNIPTSRITEHLQSICEAEGVEADANGLFRVARAAAGSMRDALSLLDQILASGAAVTEEEVVRILGAPPEEQTIQLAAHITHGDAPAALGALAELLESGVMLQSAMEGLADAFRNVMLALTCGADSELIELPEARRKEIAELSADLTLPVAVQAVGVLNKAARDLRISSLPRALAEAAIIRLAEADKFIDAASLLQRLEGGGGAQPMPPRQKKKSLAAEPAGQFQPSPAPPSPGTKKPRDAAPPSAPSQAALSPSSQPSNVPPPSTDSSAGEPSDTEPPPEPTRRSEPLSTEQRYAFEQEPAVQNVMSLFGGELVDVRREEPDRPGPAEVAEDQTGMEDTDIEDDENE